MAMTGKMCSSRFLESILLVTMLAAGFGLRMLNLTNPPLDFHPTRQLRSAIITRGMYYQMLPDADPAKKQIAIDLWQSTAIYEPPILERIVSVTYYLVGGEYLWIARLYSSLFWIIGGLALYSLARRMIAPAGSMLALGFYLVLPLSVVASRSFQPDPFMVMWLNLTLYSLYRWSDQRSWKWAIISGISAGLTSLVKIYAAIILAPVLVLMVLSTIGFLKALKNVQVWFIALVSIAIPAAYYLLVTADRSMSSFSYWFGSFTNLWLDPRFYFSWLKFMDQLFGAGFLVLSLAGLILTSSKGKPLLLGCWIGYFIYGMLTGYRIYTHEYYQLLLVPIMALSLAALFSLVVEKILLQPSFWQGLALLFVIGGVVVSAWLARNAIVYPDYTSEAGSWQQMGLEMPRDGRIIALTHDYGTRLEYYGWIQLDTWPYVADFYLDSLRNSNVPGSQLDEQDFDQYFQSKIEGHKYFLVTLFNELDAQPLLKEKLYSNYPIYRQGDGYILFDLQNPIPATQ